MKKQPNIVLLSTHDTGRHLGCYGNAHAPTPVLDRLAGEGVLCQSAFATAPICSPSRASMTTGLYPQRHGVMGISTHPWNWPLLTPERHLSHSLRRAGYETALFGVRHETRNHDALGFDHFPAPQVPVKNAIESAEEFKAFLRVRNGQPFYCQIGFFETHTPYQFGGATDDGFEEVDFPPHLAREESLRRHLLGLQGSLRQLDAGVGKILAALDESGLAEDTLVVFTSDHGLEVPRAKWNLYDPGLEVALLFRWPAGGLSGGRMVPQLMSNVDLAPTILDLAGINSPAGGDGQSAAAWLNGAGTAGRDFIFGFQHGYEARCIRTSRWKLIRNFELHPALRTPASMDHPNVPGGVQVPFAELYDLPNDPCEFQNLADDPAARSILCELNDQLMQWMREVDDPILRGPLPTPYYAAAKSWQPGQHPAVAPWGSAH